MKRILIIDDEIQMQSLISFCIRPITDLLETASSGKEALSLLENKRFDLLLLDMMMPEMDGFELLHTLKEQKVDVPVIILSAMGETEQVVKGLNLGAYDYVTKPFEPKELVARVNAVLRRTRPLKEVAIKSLHGITIDTSQNLVFHQEQMIAFTKKEYQLFLHLFSHPGRVYTREQLMYLLWEDADDRDFRNVDTHIKNIRLKLKQAGVEKSIVETVWGIGYRLSPQEGLNK